MEKDKMDGYAEARKVDKILSDLLEKRPIRKQPEEWLRLLRTIKTTVDLIEHGVFVALYEDGKIKGIPQ